MKDESILKNNNVDLEKSLELLGDMNTYNDIMNDFLSIIDEKMSLLNNYLNTNDMNNYSIEVHALKSNVRYLGFMDLGNLAYDLELKSKSNELEQVSLLHPKLINEIDKMKNICLEYLNSDKTTNKMDVLYDPMSEALKYQVNTTTENENNNTSNNGIILIVDDSLIVANFIKRVFDKEYEVVIANDGLEAMKLVSEESFRSRIKTCLLDLNMPGVNGFEVLDFYKDNNYFVKMPVVVISGIENSEIINKAKSYPIIDVLEKPFNERDVINCVNKCLAAYF